MTAGELKEVLKDVPDGVPVWFYDVSEGTFSSVNATELMDDIDPNGPAIVLSYE